MELTNQLQRWGAATRAARDFLAGLGETAFVTVRFLVRSIGAGQAAAVIAEVSRDQLRGEPFAHLPPPADRDEAGSRRQVGPAILIYRALERRLGSEHALELTREIVVAASVGFLGRVVGAIDRDRVMAMSPGDSEAWLRGLGARFPNAEMRWDEVSDQRVVMTVTHCRFPELCREAGAPELAPLMCRGDEVFFGGTLGEVELIRPPTLAEGGDCCSFELRWKQR